MFDIQDLINTILSDPKVTKGGNLAPKVYRDEPILFTASQMERQSPSKYRAMRKIATAGGPFHREPEARIFYEQGKFMEDFEDDIDFQGEFTRYYPTYQAMTDHQLRGYFSWRTKVRRGVVERTSLSFVYVYIYELINQIGTGTPEAGFQTLKGFWTAYREINPQIDRYLKIWLKDYVIYYNLDKSLLDDFSDAHFDQAVLTLMDYKTHGVGEVFSALNALSSYNLENSCFYKQRPEEFQSVVYDVFALYSDHYDKNCRGTLCEKFFGKAYASPYSMFSSAVFYPRAKPEDFVYAVNSIYKYTRQNGQWSCERFFCYSGKIQRIGDLLKTVDFLLRQKYNFKSTLKSGPTTKILSNIIAQAIEKNQADQREAAQLKIEIDVTKLQGIRRAALATQSKLILDEPEDNDEPPVTPAGEPASGIRTNLGETERLLLGRLLNGQRYDDLLATDGLMLTVLVDAINEKLYDLFGDTVIIEGENGPELLADYIDELKGLTQA